MTEPRFRPDVLDIHRPYSAAADRYEGARFRQVGSSGLYLPAISLGLWWNFGDNIPLDNQRELLRHAFDRGITHFDLANNYGPPYGSAEKNFGRIFAEDFTPYRDELIISSKAGWDMWPGPTATSAAASTSSRAPSSRSPAWGWTTWTSSTRTAPTRSPRSRRRSERWTPWSVRARRCTSASPRTARSAPEAAADIARELGTPLVIHQPAYSILNRWVEDGLTESLREEGMGAIAFTPLAQGLLTGKYLRDGVAERAQKRGSLRTGGSSDEGLATLRALDEVAGNAARASPSWPCSGCCGTAWWPRR